MCPHKRAGIVSTHNPDDWPPPRGDAHASQSVCAREECIEKAIRWAAGTANRSAAYYPDDRPGGPFDRAKMGTPRAERLARYAEEAHRGS